MTGPLVVVGDTLLDLDTEGSASRLSPEAPVPVVDDPVDHSRPGGAGLAALMAARDGRDVVLVTALADDEAGRRLRGLLDGVHVVALPATGETPVKHRIRAGGQCVVRLDRGGARPSGALTAEAVDVVGAAGALLVSDYGRGTVDVPGMRAALSEAGARVPLVWDPHPKGARPVPGSWLVTPNRSEAAYLAAALDDPATPGQSGLAEVSRQAETLLRAWRARSVAVTLGRSGALLTYGDGVPVVTPAPCGPAGDTCGAGDRFAVSAAAGLMGGLVTSEAVSAAVAAAAAYVHAGGPAGLRGGPPPSDPAGSTLERVRRARGVVVATGGCFDLLHAGHVAMLSAARRLGDCLVVCLNSDASAGRLKGSGRPVVPAADRRRVLLALEDVDEVVVFDEDTPAEAIRQLRPDVWAKGGDYDAAGLPEAPLLREWGGQAVLLPYLEGRSTSRLVRASTRPPVAATEGSRS